MLAVVLVCFAVGLALQRLAPRTRALIGPLDHAVISITLPALILAKLPEIGLGADLVVPVAVAWATIAVGALGVVVGARQLGWSRSTVGALLLVTPLGNTTFLGLALVESLLGEEGLSRALAYDQLGSFLGLTVYGSVIAARWGTGEAQGASMVGRLLRFPPFLAVVASFALRAVALPEGLDDALYVVGRLVGPVAMLTLGLRFRVSASRHRRSAALWCLGTKMALMPLAALAVATLAGRRADPAWAASVLQSGMPPMVTAGVVAARADLDEELATTVIGVGLLLALVTVPLLSLAVG